VTEKVYLIYVRGQRHSNSGVVEITPELLEKMK